MIDINFLKEQFWFWILLGIGITYFIFYIAKGFIVLIGGTFLGMYMYNSYKNKNSTLLTMIQKALL